MSSSDSSIYCPLNGGKLTDHKLADWYKAVMSLRHPIIRDYLLVLLFTGLRRNEAATLKWSAIDFQSKVLSIRSEFAKNHHEHRLPLSTFLETIFKRRFDERTVSEYVFPGRGGTYIKDSGHVIEQVCIASECHVTLHDLRRTFLTTAEKLGLSYVILKKLANHSGRNDTTFGYLVVDVERLREPMQKISDQLLSLMAAHELPGKISTAIGSIQKYIMLSIRQISDIIEIQRAGNCVAGPGFYFGRMTSPLPK